MPKCPFCDYTTPEEGDVWMEIAHMQTVHPEVIAERLRSAGVMDLQTGFGEVIGPVTLHIPGDMSVDDFRLLVQIVADANKAAGLRDKRIQRIETALDTTLMELERKMS